jgi:WD40 repeat protein
MAASASDAGSLVLPENSSALPDHPSTKLLPAKSSNLKRSEGSIIKRSEGSIVNAVKAQIAKEKEIEKTKEPEAATESIASLTILSPHLRTKEGTECFGNTDSVNCIELFPNGEFASGSGDGRILIWNEGTGEVVQILQNHQGPVLSMKANVLGRKLITGSSDMSIKKWDLVRAVLLTSAPLLCLE